MAELIAKVEELLNKHFPSQSNKFELEETIPGEKIGGSFITERFRGVDPVDRQTAMRRMLRENLSQDEIISVGLIWTLTPQEVARIEEDAVAA